MPDIPDFHEVSRATGENESAKHPENAIERQILILANEINEDDGNCVIRKRDQSIGNDVQPDDPGIPQVAISMRHELARSIRPGAGLAKYPEQTCGRRGCDPRPGDARCHSSPHRAKSPPACF